MSEQIIFASQPAGETATVDFAWYTSSPSVTNLNSLRDANGVVSLTTPAQITDTRHIAVCQLIVSDPQ